MKDCVNSNLYATFSSLFPPPAPCPQGNIFSLSTGTWPKAIFSNTVYLKSVFFFFIGLYFFFFPHWPLLLWEKYIPRMFQLRALKNNYLGIWFIFWLFLPRYPGFMNLWFGQRLKWTSSKSHTSESHEASYTSTLCFKEKESIYY